MNIIIGFLQKLLFRKQYEVTKLKWEKARLEQELNRIKQQ